MNKNHGVFLVLTCGGSRGKKKEKEKKDHA